MSSYTLQELAGLGGDDPCALIAANVQRLQSSYSMAPAVAAPAIGAELSVAMNYLVQCREKQAASISLTTDQIQKEALDATAKEEVRIAAEQARATQQYTSQIGMRPTTPTQTSYTTYAQQAAGGYTAPAYVPGALSSNVALQNMTAAMMRQQTRSGSSSLMADLLGPLGGGGMNLQKALPWLLGGAFVLVVGGILYSAAR